MTTKLAEPRARQWTKAEYYRLADEGWFQGQRVELLDGEIIQMPAQGHAHVKAVSRMGDLLRKAFGEKHWVRSQAPLDISDRSQPEPDVAVAEQSIDDYTDHPVSSLLAVEISDSTLRHDRRKGAFYAASAVQEYWILNLQQRQLEVYREPREDRATETGWSYAQRRVLSESDEVSPLARPAAVIRVAEMLA